jgi:hypothetical protein
MQILFSINSGDRYSGVPTKLDYLILSPTSIASCLFSSSVYYNVYYYPLIDFISSNALYYYSVKYWWVNKFAVAKSINFKWRVEVNTKFSG